MEETRADRRSPDRQRFVVRLLRRVAVLSLFLAAVLWFLPRVLVQRGVLGPDTAQTIATASSAVQAARAYGADEGYPEIQRALRELETARSLLAAGREGEAREASARAAGLAIAAQRRALVAAAGAQERARVAYEDLDRQVVELEKTYTTATAGLGPQETSRLLSMMKATRATAGAFFLAYEEDDFERALAAEQKARAALAEARDRLAAVRKR